MNGMFEASSARAAVISMFNLRARSGSFSHVGVCARAAQWMTSWGESFLKAARTVAKFVKSSSGRVSARMRHAGAERGAVWTRQLPMSPPVPVIQTRGCGRESVKQPFGDSAVSINAPVAKEWPMRARGIHVVQVQWNNQRLFPIHA